ncbi:hypothetical protein NE237_015300 [Protea cynaroides]|uniref:Uncharacterized protein n=1 Tax=Protea cynaroides TaxID=273540 RepID=A0A9Q0KDT1_9MAGN|nr:hypothetical protein NE237_015300 [Protea cynaroides]
MLFVTISGLFLYFGIEEWNELGVNGDCPVSDEHCCY